MSSIDDAVTAVKNIVIAINNLAKTLSSSFASLSGNNAFTGTNTFLNTVTMTGAAFNEAFATIASAATTNIGAAAGNYLQVTGVTTITAFGTVQAGTERTLEFAGILTLTHNATSLILPGGASIVTAAGDTAIFRSEGSGNWRCISYSPAAGPLTGMRNRIINGDHRIDQRNAGTAVTPAATAYATDRWQNQQSTGSKLTFQQVATSLASGFPNSLKMTVAASFSPGAGDVYTVRQAIEGVNIADLGFGTASAKTITVSFWVQSSITGTYNIALQAGSGLRTYGATFTIAVANTPQLVVLTIPGDTSGAWTTNTTAGLWLQFDLGSGSNFTFAAGAWSANALYSATGATKFVAQVNGSTFLFSGVQLEPEPFATAFERRSFGFEMLLANRYYAKCYDSSVVPGTAGNASGLLRGFTNAANQYVINPLFPTRMRAAPTVATYSYATGASGSARDETGGVDVVCAASPFETNALLTMGAAGATHQMAVLWTADAEL